MSEKAKSKISQYTFNDASVLRKFTILFILMSLTPMSVLYYFYFEVKNEGAIQLSPDMYNVMMIFVVLGIMLGYFKMREILVQLIKLTQANQKALESVLSPEVIEEMSYERNEISILAKAFSEVTRKLEDNVKSLQVAKKTLHSVLEKVGRGISNMQNIDTFLELILETVTDALVAQEGMLFFVSEDQSSVTIKTCYGKAINAQGQSVKLHKGSILQKAIETKTPIVVKGGEDYTLEPELKGKFLGTPFMCAALSVKKKVMGVIVVSHNATGKYFDEEDINLLNHLAAQTAVAIQNSRLNKDKERTYFETISALALAVDAKDKYSRGHLDRVANYCVMIGERLGLDAEDIHTLRDAARLHDLGKIGVPDMLLVKDGPLTVEETALMRRHPEIGESIIKPIGSLSHLCDLIRHHHEKLNGTGYPDGLKGEEISPLVRILTIADIYDALTSNRPYRDKMSQVEACKILREMKSQVDQDIVEVFVDALEEK